MANSKQEKEARPINPLLRNTAERPEPGKKLANLIKEEPTEEDYDEPAMPRTRRRRAVKFDELYDPLSSYIDKQYVPAFNELIDKIGPNKTTILNEAIYDVILKHRDILETNGIDINSLPKPRR